MDSSNRHARAALGLLLVFVLAAALASPARSQNREEGDATSLPLVTSGLSMRDAFKKARGKHRVVFSGDYQPPFDTETQTFPPRKEFRARGTVRLPNRRGIAKLKTRIDGETFIVTAKINKIRYRKFQWFRRSGRRKLGKMLYVGQAVVTSSAEWLEGLGGRFQITVHRKFRKAKIMDHINWRDLKEGVSVKGDFESGWRRGL